MKCIQLTAILFIIISCTHIQMLSENKSSPKTEGTTQSTELSLDETATKTDNSKNLDQSTQDKQNLKLTSKPTMSAALQKHCKEIEDSFKRYKWDHSNCESIEWKHVRNSVQGRPLFWTVFGNESEHKAKQYNATMILCGVHGDEITPIKFCFDVINHFKNSGYDFNDQLLVVAPVVNPDSYFKKKPTRTNARGIDINRNFPTKDWWKKARQLWKSWYRKDKRRNPGRKPISEPEVLFQVNLIKRYRPAKIISVHAPLTMIDYDGPAKNNNEMITNKDKSANQLLIQMSQKAAGYRVKNYRVFPGSLGNYAGNERNIPTYTLELPTSDYTKSDQYWKLFKESIDHAVKYDFRRLSYTGKQQDNSNKPN